MSIFFKPRILLVDSQDIVRTMIRLSLGSEEIWDVSEAADGKTALNTITTSHFDLVVSGIQMPGINGFTLLRQIRGNPSISDLPVLIVSTDEGGYLSKHSLLLGASGFVTKNTTGAANHFRSELRRILGKRQILPQLN